MSDTIEVLEAVQEPLELMRDLLAEPPVTACPSLLVPDEVEALRLTAKAAFEDWVEARFRAEAERSEETRSGSCRMRRL